MPLTLAQLVDVMPDGEVVAVAGDASVPVTAPVVESALEVAPGGVFVARRGRVADGHDFIGQAVERGAAAVVGERPPVDLPIPYVQVRDAWRLLGALAAAYHGFPSRKLIVIGVTGTNGKTTTTTLVHSILNLATGGKAGFISTLAADLGGTTADTGLHVTTPHVPQVQAYLAEMAANGMQYAVLEATSHGLEQGRLNGVDFDVAVYTNVTHEHLDYHGSFEKYRAAKGILYEILGRSHRKQLQGQPVEKIAIVNADDPSADFFAAFPADHVIRYGMGDLDPARPVDYAPDRTVMHLIRPVEMMAELQLVGAFNVQNALAAIHTAAALGIAPEHIAAGLARVNAISGRMQRIDEGQTFTAIVDFAHTPDALEKALETCRAILPDNKRLIAVFGSAGLRDVAKRRLMAEVSARLADMTVLTAEDPRTEPLDTILQMMAEGCEAQGGIEGETFIRVSDRGEALFRACQMAGTGDIVIACGKGHEQSMCFGTVEHPWDDRDAMRAALRGEPLRTLPTAQNLPDQ
jgi:UDP-N-acetylmuramoyl-L-alanyl-D-glutamate--2,6-diaminopimelate ligase